MEILAALKPLASSDFNKLNELRNLRADTAAFLARQEEYCKFAGPRKVLELYHTAASDIRETPNHDEKLKVLANDACDEFRLYQKNLSPNSEQYGEVCQCLHLFVGLGSSDTSDWVRLFLDLMDPWEPPIGPHNWREMQARLQSLQIVLKWAEAAKDRHPNRTD